MRPLAKLRPCPRTTLCEPPLAERLGEAEADRNALTGILSNGEVGAGPSLSTSSELVDKSIIANWREKPGLMLYKLQANGYKFSWLLIPLSLPFVSLLFARRRRFNGYNHAIFITYSLSFMSFLFIALSLLGAAGVLEGLLVAASVIIPPLHMYKQMRGAYALSRVSALWRLVLLLGMILLVLLLFVQVLLLLGGL